MHFAWRKDLPQGHMEAVLRAVCYMVPRFNVMTYKKPLYEQSLLHELGDGRAWRYIYNSYTSYNL